MRRSVQRVEGGLPTRREEILHAARKLMAAAGVRATSMRQLAGEVGVTEGALYRHFPSKEAIVGDLFTCEAERFHDHLAAGMGVAGPFGPSGTTVPRLVVDRKGAWSELDRLVAAFIDFGRCQTDSFRLIVELHETQARPRGRKPRTLFIQALDRIAVAEGGSFSDPAAVVVMLVGMLSRLILAELAGELRLGPDDVVRLAQRSARSIVKAARETLP